jgi:thiamine biosynthesis lipoprotein
MLTSLAGGCGAAAKKRYEAEFLLLFDTVTKVVGYAKYQDEFMAFATFVHDEFEQYHRLFNIYDSFEGVNNLRTVNENAGKAAVKVDRRIIDLLLFSKTQYAATGGKVNIALGAVLRLWHDYRIAGIDDPENAKLPSQKELKAAAEHTDIDDIVIDEAASTVYLRDSLMSLDVGAVAKGYAVEMVARLAEERGYDNALLSAGGNVRTVGRNGPPGGKWNIGIQDPNADDGRNLLTVSLTAESVVTSGDYRRYYTVGGKAYHHIIDTDTLFPADYFTSVTVITKDSGVADSLSTALFCMPLDKGKALIRNMGDAEALWMLQSGEIVFSDGFRRYEKSAE